MLEGNKYININSSSFDNYCKLKQNDSEMATTRNIRIKTAEEERQRKRHERHRRLQAELKRRAEMMLNDPVAFEAMRVKERELWKEKQNRLNGNGAGVRQYQYQIELNRQGRETPVPELAKVHVNKCKFCFICLNDTCSENYNDEECTSKCLKVLTFYLLQNSPSSSSPSTREDLHGNILSSLESRELSICAKCFSRADNLVKLHTELEVKQTDIENILRNFQDAVKTSLKNLSGPICCDDKISRFQEYLRNQSVSCGSRWRLCFPSFIISSTIFHLRKARIAGLAPERNSCAAELKTDVCLICSGDTSTDLYDNWKENPLRSHRYNSMTILTAYLLPNTSNETFPTEGLQVNFNFLSSLLSGRSSICMKCLSKATNLMDLHLNLEKLQLQILEVLRNLRDYLKTCSERNDQDQSEIEKYLSPFLSHFQQILNEKFMSSKLNEGMEVRLERLSKIDICPKNSSKVPLTSSPEILDNLEKSVGNVSSPVMDDLEIEDEDYIPEEYRQEDPDSNGDSSVEDDDYIPEVHQENPDSNDNDNSSVEDEDYDPKVDDEANRSKNVPKKRKAPRKQKNGTKPKRKRHYKPGPFPCPSCPSIFNSCYSLRRHKKTHEEGWKPETECPICQKVVMKTSLRNHIKKMHKNKELEEEGTFICEAESCQKRFKTQSRLNKHIERIHKEGKGELFCCASCPKEFKSYTGLRYHEISTHGNPNLVVCPHCPKMFRQFFLPQHIRNVHGDKYSSRSGVPVSLLQCQYCPKTFSVAAFLRSHEDAHRAEKKYKCNECSFVCSTLNSLNSHKTTHKEKTFQCQFKGCSKIFATKSYLRNHERSHTKEKLFKCYYCEKSFSLSSNRITHMRNQHGYVPKRKYLAGVGLQKEEEKKTGDTNITNVS